MSFFKISSISSLIFDCELKLTVLIIIIFFGLCCKHVRHGGQGGQGGYVGHVGHEGRGRDCDGRHHWQLLFSLRHVGLCCTPTPPFLLNAISCLNSFLLIFPSPLLSNFSKMTSICSFVIFFET